ncbi:MAG: cytochrome C oxidase subunit IV family protein [Pseudomonadota bacterium]|jgi:cytochrome c oxidase subunit 4
MAHSHNAHSHNAHEEHGHVVPVSTFFKVLVALLILTVITVLAAQVDLGKWNIAGALVIASIKASLVILVFMHGKYENRIIWTYILIPFILLAIMIGGVFTDDPFRDRLTPVQPQGQFGK